MPSDDLQRRALLNSLAARLPALGTGAIRVLERIVHRLARRQQRDSTGGLDELRTWTRDQWPGLDDDSETVDDAIAAVADQLVLEDQERASRREAARAEMVGGPIDSDAPAATFLRIATPLSIMDAGPALKAKALDQMEQECRRLTIESERCGDDDDEPGEGPHAHVYVGTDRGDECQICGRLEDQFADLHDDFDRNRRRGARIDDLELGGEGG